MRGHIRKRVKTGADGKPKTYWYVVVDLGQDADGKRRQKWHGSYKTRREAENASTKIVSDLEQRTYVEPTKLTLAEYVHGEWLPLMKSQLKASTWDSYRRNLVLHVLPVLGARQLQAITAGHLNALYRGLLVGGRRNGKPGRGLSPKTVRYIHTTINKLLSDAVDQELIGRNPAMRAKPPRPTPGTASMRFWTPDQLATFLRLVADHKWFALWRLAAMTGMRRGELLGLRWADVDFDHSRIAVRRTWISIAYRPELSTPKTHRARVIDIDGATLAALRALKLQQSCLLAAKAATTDDDVVFTDEHGQHIHPETVRTTFEHAIGKMAIPRIRFHDLRHTHATIALRAGVPVKVISERLGHATPAFTLQQYAHVIPGMQAEAAQQVADLVETSIESPADE